MTFADRFREKYRVALYAARGNDVDATIAGLKGLYDLFDEQYALKNGDSVVTKAKLSYWQKVFGGYIEIIRNNGLTDRRVQKFFGLIIDDSIPSFGDIMGGQGSIAVPKDSTKVTPDAEVNIEGIMDTPIDENPRQPQKEKPFTPKIPVIELEPNPVQPVEPKTPDAEQEPRIPVQPVEPPIAVSDKGGSKGEPTFAPDTLEGFIGQQHIVQVLLKEIAIAKAQGRKYLDNILLFGNPGLGKSTLMQLIAKALGVRFEWMDCSQYRNSKQSLKALQNFLMRVARENEPVVIAFDEIHMLTEELQSSLLTLLNSRVYISPPDINGNVKRIPIDNFTFIAATTDDNKVLSTIKDRCLRLKFQMEEYKPDELKRIYKNKVAAKGLTITDEAIEACIPRSRGSIRYVNSFVDGLDTALYDNNGQRVSTNIDLDVVKKYFEERGIDAIGLEKKDLEILRVLEENGDKPMGEETIAARIGMDTRKYSSEYEPYLIKIGFIEKTSRGRYLKEKAIKYLQTGELCGNDN